MLIEAGLAAPPPTWPVVIDHVGFVVGDLNREVAIWRDLGFQVSSPEALMRPGPDGRAEPLGQRSAHVVFDNAYVELSTPIPGSGNHLEPFLAIGEGARIMVLGCNDAETARLAAGDLAASPALIATREIRIGAQRFTARFRWFRLLDAVWPGVLCAVVEHVSPDLVFHPALAQHENGFRRVAGIAGCGVPEKPAALDFGAVKDRGAPLISSNAAASGGLLLEGATGKPERFFAFVP